MRKIDIAYTQCARCHVAYCVRGYGELCDACRRFCVSANGARKPAHRPIDDESNPWQENAIRHMEDAASDLA